MRWPAADSTWKWQAIVHQFFTQTPVGSFVNPMKSNIFEAQNFISTKSQLLTIERNYRYLPENKLCEYLHNNDHKVTVNNCMIELVSHCLTEKIEVPGTPVTAPQLLIEDWNMIYMNSINKEM